MGSLVTDPGAVADIPALEEEVDRLKALKGPERIKIEAEDTRKFQREFLASEKFQKAWRSLYATRKDIVVPALIVLFLSQVPRFYKIARCQQFVEVCGYLCAIRTQGQIHSVEMGDLAQTLYSSMACFIEDSFKELGLGPAVGGYPSTGLQRLQDHSV